MGGWLSGLMVAVAVIVPGSARADVVVQIDKSSQRMTVSLNGAARYNWPVSTGRSGYGTPSGEFRPQTMARRWFSRKYYNSPMPHAIFFYYGFAIHGTTESGAARRPGLAWLCQVASVPCRGVVRLVQHDGPRNTRIMISN
ncbi:MAG: hypothetical protein JWQ17_4249 [Tardiphaga sp.]|nr:hypothetical protein [Tardiphaga sp.]